jgi:galactokinase
MERRNRLSEELISLTGCEKGDVRFFTAAGRTELGGNHTDHNQGKVLAASIQLDALAAVIPTDEPKVFFRSTGHHDVVVEWDPADPASLEPRDS